MSVEIDDKGKIFTEVVSKVAVPAIVQTTQHLIQGNVHVRRDERLKDELDRDEFFLAVTNARVLGADGQLLYQARFLAVQRTQIVWVMPVQGKTGDLGDL